MDLPERLSSAPFILLDGAMGTELQRRGVRTELPLWSAMANLEAPIVVKDIHAEYIDAGADMITANTFRTTAYTLNKTGKAHLAPHLTRLAMELAREAITQSGRDALLAASLAPLEDCFSPDLVPTRHMIMRVYDAQIALLLEAGADYILAETMINRTEIECVTSLMGQYETPWIISCTADEFGHLLDGTSLREVAETVAAASPVAILINCRPCNGITAALHALKEVYHGTTGAYGNGPGRPDDALGWVLSEGSIEEYTQAARVWLRSGAQIIGGCCGTTPEHIRALHALRNNA